MRLRTGGILIAIALLPLTATVRLAEGSWIEVPAADVDALEPAVAEQLTALRDLVESLAADSEVPAPKLGEAVGELGQHYHAYALAKEAEESYRIAGRLAPEDFRWSYLLAYLLQTSGRLEEAATLYEGALARVPDVGPALIRLGHTYLDLNRPGDAEAVLLRAAERNPASVAARAGLGEVYLFQQRYPEAIELLESALEGQPQANRLYYSLALAYRGAGDLDKAQKLLTRRGEVGVRPADPLIDGLVQLTTGERVHLLRGRSAFDAGSFEVAAEEFEKALAAEPDSVRARLNLASALAQIDRVDEAVGHLEEVIRVTRGNPTAYYNLALLQDRKGQTGLALENYRQAVSYAPEDAEMRLALADSLRQADLAEEALVQYGRAVALDPALEFAWVGEADALARLGRFEEALNRLETAHGLMPTSGPITHGLARLLAGSPRASLRDGERAVGLAESVFAALPSVAHLKTVAMAHAEVGACDVAAAWIDKGVASLGESAPPQTTAELQGLRERYAAGPPCRPPALPEPTG
jgi:tetratricopeptide (TPR) repeat protein